MIFYFSGTGNSQWVAQFLADELNDTMRFIPDELNTEMLYTLKDGERLGFVFPTYGWGVPPFIEQFISKMQVGNVDYLYFVTTCGDDTGMTAEIFCDIVARKGWRCKLGYAVQMPESYVCLPGFDVDPMPKEQRKLNAVPARIHQIVDDIIDGRSIFDTLPGSMPWVKSHIVRPFFNRFLVNPRYFKTNDQCVGCGSCVEACPFGNITLTGTNHPLWHERCVQCMRCYHTCPHRAIEWGRFTRGKGQYLNRR